MHFNDPHFYHCVLAFGLCEVLAGTGIAAVVFLENHRNDFLFLTTN